MDGFFAFFDQLRDAVDVLGIPAWLEMPLIALGVAIAVDLLFYFVLKPVERRLQKTSNRWDDVLVASFRAPFRVWIWMMALATVVLFIGAHFEAPWVSQYMPTVIELLSLMLFGWLGWRFISRIEPRMVNPPANSNVKPLEKTTMDALTKVFGAVLVTVVGLWGLKILGVSLSGVLAFGGFGGLMAGFAARDLLANFFGGMVVHVDRPFKVGDWVRSPDREIEGVVEDIGWRLTRIRTFPGPPLYVPNAIFSRIVVENPSRMISRRIWETIRVRYEDVQHIDPIVDAIRQMLQDMDDIDHDESITVCFNGISDYSLDIMVYAFTEEIDWQRFHDIKHRVLLGVRDIVYDQGAELALPLSKLHMATPVAVERSQGYDAPDSSDDEPDDEQNDPDDAQAGTADEDDAETSRRQGSSESNSGRTSSANRSKANRSGATRSGQTRSNTRRSTRGPRQGPSDDDASSNSTQDAEDA
ncbi:mechanosensitive ion channel domain-containing protein [Larsenimonas suaedae]|uniref:Mechanosensitive ion channel n=1 Tax=Larsenimonas suaedae TaxID=1851019 RepID=A0ABU1GUS5_9GAMM|nr:mechanosensitive ion channel domain-containing protein [Larsenimonas suaedae]MCM2971084.1 mechanosensitive ion channel [Larsenimonas suaedae]MDR5895793.1 mechanosensitive ion channel [Larsenimonas suaedae]